MIAVDDALQELKSQDDMIKLEVSRNVLSDTIFMGKYEQLTPICEKHIWIHSKRLKNFPRFFCIIMLYVYAVILLGLLNAETSNVARKLSVKFSYGKAGLQRENCEVSCAIWEELFEDIDDTFKDLKRTDDIMKSDIVRKVFRTL